jgi:CRP-like cAMP-binding protein
MKLNALIENRTYEPGEVLIHKGDTSRDLIFLTEGRVEISKKEGDGTLILNEIEPPYILGDIAFLSGLPRTATAKATTEVKTFVLKYQDFRDVFKSFPEWLHPLLTAFASAVKSLHHRSQGLERRIEELGEERPGRAVNP